MKGPHKLAHPLGLVKGGSTKPPGRTLQPPQKASAAPQPAAKAPVVEAVNALKPTAMLARLAAQVSNTEQRSPSSGR